MVFPENVHRSMGDVFLLDVREEDSVLLVSQQIQDCEDFFGHINA